MENVKQPMVLIENDGALFRGPARGLPQEVWNVNQGKFIPYAGAGKQRDVSWGSVISPEEAEAMIGQKLPADAGAEEPDKIEG